jgi:opacity protein-like surface antigen
MKKLLATFCAIFLVSSSASATGFFVGADVLQANASHKAINPTNSSSGPQNQAKQDGDRPNYGLSTGIRADVLNLMVSGELFYDSLNTVAGDFPKTDGAVYLSDNIKLKDRSGVKANIGFAILPKITPFVTFGAASVTYQSNVHSSGATKSKSEMTPLYGVGILLDLPFGVTAKASYDYQKFDMRYAQAGSKIETTLGVAKLGLIYNF